MTDTPTTDRDDPVSSALVAACEQAWADIKAHHPELPNAVIVLGTGMKGGRLVKLGHWWQSQWIADGQARAEVLLAGEALHLPADDVVEILLHEAAHGVNSARGVKDTSRGGRYHNERFKQTAEEVGLRVERMDPYGWAKTSLTPVSRERYGPTIDQIREHLRIARTLPANLRRTGAEAEGGNETGTSNEREGKAKNPAAQCGCGRKMRMADSVLAQGPVRCGLCETEFAKPHEAERQASAASPAPDDEFLRRRATQTAGSEVDRVAEGKQHLDAIARALSRVASESGDAELIEVFERERPGIEQWFDELVTADVVHLPGRVDLRTAHLPGLTPTTQPEPQPRAEIEGVEL